MSGTENQAAGRASSEDPAPSIQLSAFDGAAFDLDGVVTQTAGIHAAAWKRLFDAFLANHGDGGGAPFVPFDIGTDYVQYVDGKPREDGVRDFLASRGIVVPEGMPDDSSERDTVHGLGRRKNAMFRAAIATQGVRVFDSSIAFLRELRQAGIRTAVVSSSENTTAIVSAAGLDDLFEVRVDALEAARLGLKGKPAPDTFLHAARMLQIAPSRMMGIEDSLSGARAIAAAGYGLVIGIDRRGQAAALAAQGAGMVVRDLGDVRLVKDRGGPWFTSALPVGTLSLTPEPDPAWTVIEDGFTLAREHEIESLFAIGNGHIGSRGSLAEGSRLSAPATFVAGVFDETPAGSMDLAGLPDWAHLSLSMDGQALNLQSGRILEHRRILDLRQAVLFRAWRHEDPSGRISCIRGFRLASAADRQLLLQSVAWSPENYSGGVALDASIAAPTTLKTSGGITLSLAARSQLIERRNGAFLAADIAASQTIDAQLGGAFRFDRVVAVHTSRDSDDPALHAREHAEQAHQAGIAKLAEDHRRIWTEHWSACDLRIDGDPDVQRALRFAIYHLLSAADPHDEGVSIGARGLTGPGYQGHVFWDTEIYMLPFFVLTRPAMARALLLYRHRTLPAARRRAERYANQGALYAWESADTGDDVTPALVIQPNGEASQVLTGTQEIHISADVAFAAWNYWRATADSGFLLDAGAEILLETARFWASRATLGEDGQYHVRGVIGPDEYHETVDDNAYTNTMARWNLETGAGAASLLRERWPQRWDQLVAEIGLDADEPRRWRDVARAMYSGFDPKSGLIEQFRGYFALEDIDLASFRNRNAPMEMLLGRERLQHSQIIKQADVLMLLHLFWDDYPPAVREANFRYYEPRCAHGSSLSPAIHALLAARLGDTALALRYLRQAIDIDLANNMGNAASGVHMGALGGLWQAVVFGFGGLRFSDTGPSLASRLPVHWREIALSIQWQGRRYDLSASTQPYDARQEENPP